MCPVLAVSCRVRRPIRILAMSGGCVRTLCHEGLCAASRAGHYGPGCKVLAFVQTLLSDLALRPLPSTTPTAGSTSGT
eukprot:12508880-Alexandrium_andersonii.AAC.1